MSTESEKPASSDLPDSPAPDPDTASASPQPPADPPTAGPSRPDWPAYGSWRRAPMLPLAIIAAVVLILVAGISSATGVLVGIVATRNADSHSRLHDRGDYQHGPYGPKRGPDGQHRHGPRDRPVPTTPAAPAPPVPTTPPAPPTPSARPS